MGIEAWLWNESRLMARQGLLWRDEMADGFGFEKILVRALRAKEPLGLLGYIDPYGNTVFNRPQMPTVIRELEKLAKYVQSTSEQAVLDGVLDLARACDEDVHLYLAFIGD